MGSPFEFQQRGKSGIWISDRLGLNHKKLTYRYAGRDFRLTDVHGNVADDIFA